MTGCELRGCKFYDRSVNFCTSPFNYVNKRTGEDMCHLNEDAIPRNEYEEEQEEEELIKPVTVRIVSKVKYGQFLEYGTKDMCEKKHGIKDDKIEVSEYTIKDADIELLEISQRKGKSWEKK